MSWGERGPFDPNRGLSQSMGCRMSQSPLEDSQGTRTGTAWVESCAEYSYALNIYRRMKIICGAARRCGTGWRAPESRGPCPEGTGGGRYHRQALRHPQKRNDEHHAPASGGGGGMSTGCE